VTDAANEVVFTKGLWNWILCHFEQDMITDCSVSVSCEDCDKATTVNRHDAFPGAACLDPDSFEKQPSVRCVPYPVSTTLCHQVPARQRHLLPGGSLRWRGRCKAGAHGWRAGELRPLCESKIT
jgi:hypothetical protein